MRPKYYSDELRDLFVERKFATVVSRCQDIIRELRQSSGDQHPDIVLVLEDLASAYFEMYDHRSAIAPTKEILRLDFLGLGELSADYIRNLSNLGLLYRYNGQIEESEVALDRALELTERMPLDERYERAQILIHKSRIHADRQEYKKAEQLLVEAARQRLEDYNWSHPRFAVVYQHLSRLYKSMGRQYAAQRAIQKAIRIYRAASDYRAASVDDNVRFASMLTSLGDMQADQGRLAEAKATFREALDILRRVDNNSPKLTKVEQKLLRLDSL